VSGSEWQRAARLMLAADARAVTNVFSQSPGSLLGPAFFAFTLPVMTLFPFALVFGNAPQDVSVPIFTIALAFVFVANLTPFRPPQVASFAATLPIPPRAHFAHGILRLLTTLTFGYAFAMLPILALLLVFAPHLLVDVFLAPLPFLGAAGLTAALGRAAWTPAAGRPAAEGWLLRACLLLWLSVPAILFALQTPGGDISPLFGPFHWIASWVLDPNAFGALGPSVAYLACLVAIALFLLVPVRAYPPSPEGRALRFFSLAGGPALRERASMPRGRLMLHRAVAPFKLPQGPVRAPLHLTLQWMKSFVYFGLGYMVIALTIEAVGRLQAGRRGGIAFTIDPFVFAAVVYLIALWAIGFGVDPNVSGSRYHPLHRLRRGGARPVPRVFRVGPFPLEMKRWSQLQTLPISRSALNRAFLVPMAGLLALTCTVAFWSLGGLMRWGWDSFRLAGGFACFILIATGGTFVAVRSSKRYSRLEEPALSATHTLAAALWMAAIIPLLFVGALGSTSLVGPWGPPLGEWGFAAFLLATFVMPVYAYYSAFERLVAVDRPYESASRPWGLLLGAALFFLFPVWLIAFWVLR